MKKQLRNFKSENTGNNNNNSSSAENLNAATITQAMQKYSGLSEETLLEQLVLHISAAKKNGTYNKQQMDTYLNIFSANLPKDAKEKLNNIIKIIDAQ